MAVYESRFNKNNDPSFMTDAEATRLGLRIYHVNGTYNGGVTIVAGGNRNPSFPTSNRSHLIPFQVNDGSWMLKFRLYWNTNPGTDTSTVLTLTDVSTVGLNTGGQYVYGATQIDQVNDHGASHVGDADLATFQIAYPSSSEDTFAMAGEIMLERKPNWAY